MGYQLTNNGQEVSLTCSIVDDHWVTGPGLRHPNLRSRTPRYDASGGTWRISGGGFSDGGKSRGLVGLVA